MPPEQVKELQEKAAQVQRTTDPKVANALLSDIQAAVEEDLRATERARRERAQAAEQAEAART